MSSALSSVVAAPSPFGPEQVLARLLEAGVDDAAHWAALIVDEVRRRHMLGWSRDLARRLTELCATAGPTALAERLGRVRFMGLDLVVAPGVAVPRPASERVARRALALLRRMAHRTPLRLVDLGCGAGHLAVALALHAPSARVWACDASSAAGVVTAANVRQAGVGSRVTVCIGDGVAALPAQVRAAQVDAVVSAPAGGLERHAPLVEAAARVLRPGGVLVLETAGGLGAHVAALLLAACRYEGIDLSDDGRVVHARRRPWPPGR